MDLPLSSYHKLAFSIYLNSSSLRKMLYSLYTFDVVISNVYLTYFVPQDDLHILYYAYKIE